MEKWAEVARGRSAVSGPEVSRAPKWEPTQYSQFITRKREELGLNKSQFAAKAHVDPSYISQLEAGRPPSTTIEALSAYAEALEIPTEVLIREGGLRIENIYSVNPEQLRSDLLILLGRSKKLRAAQVRQLTLLAEAMAAENGQDSEATDASESDPSAPPGDGPVGDA